jgi:opacity protein-like surface antigen
MFNVNDENFNNANFQQNRSDDGLNLNVAIAYDLTDALFVQVQYDYIRLSARNSIDSSYNKNVNIIKLGFGYRF